MSATEQIRALLDEFMGTRRDGGSAPISFDDPRVCKSFLLDSCPHEILSGTRMDLGRCSYIHDPAFKADYRRESAQKKIHYEVDALSQLELFIRDSDNRTELAKAKLRETQEELSDEGTQKVEKINVLGEQIGTKLAKAEQLGADGRVEESLQLMKEVDNLNKEKAKEESDLRSIIPMSTYQQQKLRVCEVCSAYLGVHDNDRRLADHFGGKLHLGFIEIREKLASLKEYVEVNNLQKRKRYEGYNRANFARETPLIADANRSRQSGSRSQSRGRSRSRSRSRSRKHSRSKHHKRHSSRCNGRRSHDRHRHKSSKEKSEDRR